MPAKKKTAAKKKPVARKTAKPRMVTFTPDRDLPLSIGGVTIEVQAGVETTIPAEYKTIYDNAVSPPV